VADVYDALTTKRPYKRAFPHQEACTVIVSGAGTQFDPEVVKAFVALESAFARVAQELSDGGEAMAETPDSDAAPRVKPATEVTV
jgi:putative two-component system response regulator